MSLSDKDIDTLFQRMDEKASVEYKDAYWTEMQQLLNVQERKRGFVWWLNGWVLIPAGLLLATVTAMGFSMRKPSISTEIVKNTSFVTDVDRVAQENDTQLVNFYRPTSDKLTSRSSVPVEQNQVRAKVAGQKVAANTFTSSTNSTVKTNEGNELFADKSQFNGTNVLADTRKVSSLDITVAPIIELETPSLDTPIERMNGATLEKDTMPNQGDAILQTDAITEKTNTENTAAILDKDDKMKQKWRMYVGGGLGMSSNLHIAKAHRGAGIVRLEYGFSRAFNRFSFSSAVAVENTFGNSLGLENKYVSYDFKRNDNRQEYTYNRLTNFMIPIRAGYFVGKNQRSHIQLVAMPAFTIYNNLVYKEFSNDKIVTKDEFFNQDIGLNRFFVNVGVGYDFMITNNCSLGFEYNNNLGLNRKKLLSNAYTTKSDHQFIIQLRYFIK